VKKQQSPGWGDWESVRVPITPYRALETTSTATGSCAASYYQVTPFRG